MAAKRTVQEGGRADEAKLVVAQTGRGQEGKEVRRLVFFRSALIVRAGLLGRGVSWYAINVHRCLAAPPHFFVSSLYQSDVANASERVRVAPILPRYGLNIRVVRQSGCLR